MKPIDTLNELELQNGTKIIDLILCYSTALQNNNSEELETLRTEIEVLSIEDKATFDKLIGVVQGSATDEPIEVKTYLPLFSGFYGTIWESDESNFCYENDCTYDDLIIDYDAYNKDVILGICDFVESNCEFIKSVKLENIYSPKFYNFSNDSANVTIVIKKREFKKYLNDNKEALDKYLRERYTSRDGFMSSYGNSFEAWKEETDNFKNLDNHYLGSLLQFYFDNEEITEYDAKECNEVYIDSYITIDKVCFADLDDDRKREVLQELLDSNEIDLTFGYNAIIVNECDDKVAMFGGELIDYLIEYDNLVDNTLKFSK